MHYFLPPIALTEIKSISNIANVLSRVSNVIDRRQQQKKTTTNKQNKTTTLTTTKRNNEYNQTRSVFYIGWDATT